MKEKKLPSFVRNPAIYRFFQSKPGRLLSNWAMQGMLYMNPVEIIFKLFLDVVLTGAIWITVFGQNEPLYWLVSLLLAHTVNWIINCQPVALLMHLDWGRKDARRFIEYIEKLERRVRAKPFIAAAASFGSLSKGKYNEKSDIDIRFVLPDGALARLRLAGYCFSERLRAALHWFPLDLYAFDLDEMKRKMNEDEVPVIFRDPDGLIQEVYSETVDFDAFCSSFRANVLGETPL